METDKREIALQVIVGGFFAVCCFLFFRLLLPYHLQMKEQEQLFFLTTGHFLSYFSKPAWLACYLGDFFTQFFYLRAGGAVALTAVLVVEWYLFVLAFKKFGMGRLSMLAALVPAFVECYLHTQMSYTLSSSIAVQLVLFVFLLYTCLPDKVLSILCGLLSIPLLYYIAGSLCFLFPALVIVYEISKREMRGLYWFSLVLAAGAFPYIVRPLYFLTAGQAYSYPNSSLKVGWIHTSQEDLFAISTDAYRGEWDKVLERVEKDRPEDRVAACYTNLALLLQDSLPDKLLNYYQPAAEGLFMTAEAGSKLTDIFLSGDICFHLGDMNMAHHYAMMGMINSPKRQSSRMVRRLAEINMILGDTGAAQKYLRMLDATLFHRLWAKKQEWQMGGHAGADTLLAYKRSLLPKRDLLRSTSDYVASLRVLAESNPKNTRAMHYLLCYYLLNKDLPAFSSTYETWCKGNPLYAARLYQEALLHYQSSLKKELKKK